MSLFKTILFEHFIFKLQSLPKWIRETESRRGLWKYAPTKQNILDTSDFQNLHNKEIKSLYFFHKLTV